MAFSWLSLVLRSSGPALPVWDFVGRMPVHTSKSTLERATLLRETDSVAEEVGLVDEFMKYDGPRLVRCGSPFLHGARPSLSAC